MTLTEQFLNKHLFAPARYLDRSGYRIDTQTLQKTFSAPEFKTGLIATLSTSFALAATGQTKFALVNMAMIAANGVGVSFRQGNFVKKKEYEFYFDTAPREIRPVNDRGTRAILQNHATTGRMMAILLTNAAKTGLLYGVTSFAVPMAAPIFLSLGAAHVASDLTVKFGPWWRARQVLKGNWNADTYKPEIAPETEILPVAALTHGL